MASNNCSGLDVDWQSVRSEWSCKEKWSDHRFVTSSWSDRRFVTSSWSDRRFVTSDGRRSEDILRSIPFPGKRSSLSISFVSDKRCKGRTEIITKVFDTKSLGCFLNNECYFLTHEIPSFATLFTNQCIFVSKTFWQ